VGCGGRKGGGGGGARAAPQSSPCQINKKLLPLRK